MVVNLCKMRWLRWLILVILSINIGCSAKFNTEEIRSVLYDVSISGVPLVLDSSNQKASEAVTNTQNVVDEESRQRYSTGSMLTETLIIGNKNGQQYHCKVPDLILEESVHGRHDTAEGMSFSDESVEEALSFLAKMPCLKKNLGWWTYEFCYKDGIRQYHTEADKLSSHAIILGKFQSERKWSNTSENSDEDAKTQKKTLYHSQTYVNGSYCALNDERRRAEVRFYCNEDLDKTSVYLYHIDEPTTCEYVLIVYVGALCQLPAFLPVDRKPKPLEILCQPALTQSEYEKYTSAKANEMAKLKQKVLEKVDLTGVDMDLEMTDKQDEQEKLAKWFQSIVDGITEDAFDAETSNGVEPFADELISAGEEILQEKSRETTRSQEDRPPSDFHDASGVESELKDGVSPAKKVSDILRPKTVDETHDEEDTDEEDDDEDAAGGVDTKAVKTLTDALLRLLKRLEQAEREIVDANQQLETAENLANYATERYKRNALEANEKFKDGNEAKSLRDPLSQNKRKPLGRIQVKHGTDGGNDDNDPTSDDGFKVRIRKYRQSGEPSAEEMKETQKLEKKLSDKLKEAGFSAQGQPVKVSVITDVNVDGDGDDLFRALNDDESDQVSNVILSLLGGNTRQKANEERRYKALEENYGFSIEPSSQQAEKHEKDDEN